MAWGVPTTKALGDVQGYQTANKWNDSLTYVSTSVLKATIKCLFYADAAPTGWTLDTGLDDKVVYVTKGSGASGRTGGSSSAAAGATATEASHTHDSQGHSHNIANQSGGSAYEYVVSTSAPGIANNLTTIGSTSVNGANDLETTAGTAHSHGGGTLIPVSYNFTVSTKDAY